MLWSLNWTIFDWVETIGAVGYLIDIVALALLQAPVFWFAFGLVRRSSSLPGRHLRRQAAYSFLVVHTIAIPITFFGVLAGRQFIGIEQATVQVFTLLFASSFVVLQPLSSRINIVLARMFTADIGNRVELALGLATSVISYEDLHGVLTNHLDQLRYQLDAERCTLTVSTIDVQKMPYVTVHKPQANSPSHLESQYYWLPEEEADPLNVVKIGFKSSESSSSEEEIVREVDLFNQKIVTALKWFRSQESILKTLRNVELLKRWRLMVEMQSDEIVEFKPIHIYKIDGTDEESEFFQDVQRWVNLCQSRKEFGLNATDFPLAGLKIAASTNTANPVLGFNKIATDAIKDPIPDGLRPPEPPDPDDSRWVIYYILEYSVLDRTVDRIICNRLGFEYDGRNGSQPDPAGFDSAYEKKKVFLDKNRHSVSQATYRRRKRDAIVALVQVLQSKNCD